MSYKIVFFDIDGTLVNEEKVIPADTIKAISELKEKGIEPVIATGRAPYFIKPLTEKLGIDSYVCMNGAYVVYKGQTLYKRKITKQSLETLVALAAQHDHGLVFEGEVRYCSDRDNHPFITDSIQSLKIDLPSFEPQFWRDNDIFQAFLHCESHEEHLYETLKSEFTLIRWHPQAMDVLPLGGSKAQGIAALLDKLGLTPEHAAAFGDGLNDKEMLEYVGFGVAMGNSHPELLPFANYVTTHVDENGIRNGLIEAGLLMA
ncbi:Cof-type HAD-IIB family hydrolase [Paenibacillus sp. 1011MAR3C5]|uniref:Cof-type HAD-IIB family hydrolase n=1 Tax=Paenibacillus sp. 1011MAR3C5 TaxID=1675787 RepID=UPI000E6CA7F2|nr:Cof-type HAD-IIB family hydrolase [Paenibacillus sp. 1011MAR3C5]RJE84333.1 Cof-type HAD-IIB family hydrolase [Paenibacillus sp. 1011MAR3C5]